MTNVAFDLHDLYEDWRSRIESQNKQAGHGNHSPKSALRPESAEGAGEFLLAYRLLARIDDIITELERIDPEHRFYREQFAGWLRIPLMLSADWTSAVTQIERVVKLEHLRQIKSFGFFLKGKVLATEEAYKPEFRTLIRDAAAALSDVDDLPPQLVAYLRRLLAEIQFAIDDEARGKTFDFHSAVQNLWVALEAAAEKTGSEGWRSKFKALANKALFGFAASAGGALASQGVSLGLQALEK